MNKELLDKEKSSQSVSIDRAVGTLIDRQPYFSPCVSLTKFRYIEAVETIGIRWVGDSLEIISNPEFISRWSEKLQRGLLKHEYAHYQLRHLTGSRKLKLEALAVLSYPDELGNIHNIVNICEDLEINDTVVPRSELPPGGMFPEDYELKNGLLAEEYLKLMKPHMKKILKEGNYISDLLPGEDMDELDEKDMEARIKEGLGRGDSPGGLERLLEKLRPPVLTWKRLFRSAALTLLKARLIIPTFGRLNRRGLSIPGRVYRDLPNCYVFQDTSGSISKENLVHLSSEVYGLRKYTKKIEVLVIDAALQCVYTFKNKIKSVKGGGGSDFTEAFEYVENQIHRRRPVIILMTDGDITVPDKVDADVFWVLCQGDRDIPYGHKIILT